MTSRILRRIEALDPDEDHQEIYRLSTVYEFPFDTRRALELALFRVFAVPSIGTLLHATGRFEQTPQQRYKDTYKLLYQIVEHGYDSPRGIAAIGRINDVHSRFRIGNPEMLYVLATFVLEPLRWNRQFGWRPLSSRERRAAFRFWREVGHRMEIRHIPETEATLAQYSRDFEARRFQYNAASRRVADSLRDFLAGRLVPSALRHFIYPALYSVIDEPVLCALGYPRPGAPLRACVHAALRWRGKLAAWLFAPRFRSKNTGQQAHESICRAARLT